ncbi:MAG: putative CAMK family protein kinase [Streblomastix strix]|uniref:Putative CAMK family protein kinase n=1 Tax=Streblomastix strix TaxID=222440 RepID=A0A5J4WDX2_9EUKA|nr:MAG: putative CAMK family protein kinase [Streblomastix strix]
MDYEEIIRRNQPLVPIRPLGKGSYGCVYLAHSSEFGIIAVKIVEKDKYEKREVDSQIELWENGKGNVFILKYIACFDEYSFPFIITEYANMKTLNVIVKHPQIHLPSYTLRALMKQICMETFLNSKFLFFIYFSKVLGMKSFHASGLIHRDIKCDNILLHSPSGSGRVHVKISDFGFAKKVDLINEQTYLAGTIPFMAPELFQKQSLSTQKVDIYAVGITFLRLLRLKYPVNERNFKEQGEKITSMKSIERPSEIKDDLLWNLLSKLLEFDPNKRITAAEALNNPYFASLEAIADISKEQQDLAQLAIKAEKDGDSNITEFDKDPSCIAAESVIKQFVLTDMKENQFKLQKLEEFEKNLIII